MGGPLSSVLNCGTIERTGLGDIIDSIDGTAVGTVNEFIEAIHEGDRTKMISLRADGDEKAVDVEFPERSEQLPASRQTD